MSSSSTEIQSTPLKTLETVISDNNWPYEYLDEEELITQVEGQSCDYRLVFHWEENVNALHIDCALETRLPKTLQGQIYELLALINAGLWLGHFDLSDDGNTPTFRHTMFITPESPPESLEQVMNIALLECEKYYPAFQYVIWGGRPPQEALKLVTFETIGEA